MTVYYDKSKKKWKVEVWFNNKKFKSKQFTKKAFADKFERECMNEIDRIKLTGVQYHELTYSNIFESWRVNAGNRKRPTSLVKDDQMNKQYVTPIIGDLSMREINSVHFDLIITQALKKGLTKSSVNKVIQHFKAVFKHAFISESIPRNPSQVVKQLKFQNKEMDFYFQEELDEFLSFANSKYQGTDRIFFVFYLTLFVTGMRLGEVLGLSWDCLDFKRGTILIGQIWSAAESEIVEVTKGKADRTIPMPSILKGELLALRNCRIGNLVFTLNGETPIDASNLRKRHWDVDAEGAEVRRIRIHDARHTYGAHFMMNGGSIYELQKVLGHASIKTTERYAHLAPNHLDGVRDIVIPNLKPKAEVISLQKNPLPIHSREEMIGRENAVND